MKYPFLSDIIRQKAAELGEKEALRVRDKITKSWSPISWKTFDEKVISTACALSRYGIKERTTVGVYTQNSAECFYLDFAIFANRAISVPLYATSSIPQITYIVDDSEMNLIFAGEQQQYDNAREVLKVSKFLKQIVILDKDVKKAPDDNTSVYFDEFIRPDKQTEEELQSVKKRTSEVQEDDIVHIIYTSGTTGESKGVILTQRNYLEAVRIHYLRLDYLPDGFVSMCFLPLTHIFEKAWSFFCLYKGCILAINSDPREIQKTIKEVKPHAMCSVPRFWEKVAAGVTDKIDQMNPILKRLFLDAVDTGRKYNLDYLNKNKKAPWWIQQKFKIYDKTIYKMLKKAIGIENGIIFPCAGAALSDNINTFIQSVNIPLVYGYGLTETTATVSCFTKTGFEIGTIGKVMPGVDVRIGESNEIQLKGDTVTPGYYNKPEATASAFTEDGWFRTGDAGTLDNNHNMTLTERIKDLYKTANGKYIAPQQLETRLAEDRYIEMAAVIGDRRKYVTALIIPDFEELKKYAKKHLIIYKDLDDLCKNPLIISLYKLRIDSMQNEFANYEQIKRFTLLPVLFSIESGELTNTLKMKRAFIEQKYEQYIEAMYKD